MILLKVNLVAPAFVLPSRKEEKQWRVFLFMVAMSFYATTKTWTAYVLKSGGLHMLGDALPNRMFMVVSMAIMFLFIEDSRLLSWLRKPIETRLPNCMETSPGHDLEAKLKGVTDVDPMP